MSRHESNIAPQQRITDIDALRGFALFGILVVNITFFASAHSGVGIADPAFDGTLDRLVRFGIALLFETKFYLLFSFLFGYSFTLQMQSAARAGEAFVPRLLRRQAGLWVIGLMHAVLLFHGDILTTYAVLGVVLLMLRGQGDAAALKLAFWLIAGAALAWGVIGLLAFSGMADGEPTAGLKTAEKALAAYRGTPASVVIQHLSELRDMWFVVGLIQGPSALAMFLLGFVAGRREVFMHFDAYARLFQRLMKLGLVVGLPGSVIYACGSVYLIGTPWEIAGLAVGLVTAPLLTGAYVAAIMFAFQGRWGQEVARFLAPAGRMALSNYLLQSLVCSLVFYAYGLRLMGEVSPLNAALLAVGLFVCQLALSGWWMERFAYGPLEWLLRAVTLAAWPRWRRRRVA
ncbi:DUF418 domain-containing protein [Nitratireductor soli]|uniref:DUF418 domain-containing protein n=1 Tax=Nitratireductor soli TaxID=1670619 RepID=UPI00065DD3D0|nr:DUF418 domain-containing protein [Nitratireductor soli]